MIYKLKDICIRITDGSHFSPKAKTNGYPMFSVKDMLTYGFDYSNCKRICKEDFEKMLKSGCVPQAGDVLVAKDGSYLKEIFVCTETKKEAVLSSIAIFRPNQKIVNSYFLCYLLKSPNIYNYISSNCVSGSALPRIILKAFKEIEVDIPDLHVQENIVRILKLLDEKIALNTRINRNLSEQAKILYKEWFIDFGPFEGEMPGDWHLGTVEEIIELHDSKRKPLSGRQRDDMEKIYPYYGATSIMDYVDNYIFDGIYLLLGEDGSVIDTEGYPILQYVFGKFWPNNHAHVITGKNGFSVEMLYLLFSLTNVQNIVTGAVQLKISQQNLKTVEVVIPSYEAITEFDEMIQPIFREIRRLRTEKEKLTTLRDNLLPKLMSGELDVSNLDI